MQGNFRKYPQWLPAATLGFITGALAFGLASGVLTGTVQDDIARSEQLGFDAGYAAALEQSPAVEVQETAINIISSAIFMGNLEVEIKAISRQNNAIEFTYGEKGGERFRVPGLHVGDAIAHRMGNNLYTIKNVSVSANLQRATVEVTRIKFPAA